MTDYAPSGPWTASVTVISAAQLNNMDTWIPRAQSLTNATGFVYIGGSAAPTAGQALVASSGTVAGWATLSSSNISDFSTQLATRVAKAGDTMTGLLTINPANVAGLQEGIRLVDSGNGAGEGMYIRWDAGTGGSAKLDQARIGIVTNATGSGSDLVLYVNSLDIAGGSYETVRFTGAGDMKMTGVGNIQFLALSGAFPVAANTSVQDGPALLFNGAGGNNGGISGIGGGAGELDIVYGGQAGNANVGTTAVIKGIYCDSAGVFTTTFLLNSAGQLQLPATGSTGGFLIGGDAVLWRDAAAVLRTSGKLRVDTAPASSTDTVRLTDIGSSALTQAWVPGIVGPLSTALRGNSTNAPRASGIGFSSDKTVVVVATAEITSGGWTIYISTDSGRTYAKSAASPTVPSVSTGPSGISIFVTDSNTVSIAYPTTTSGQVAFSKTTNGGTSWTTNTKTVTGLTAATVSFTAIGVDTAVCAYSVGTTSVGYAYTSNAGSAWTSGTVATETVTNNAGNFAVAALDTTTIFVFWSLTGANLRWSKTTNSGTSWSAAANAATDSATSSVIMALMTSANHIVVNYATNAATVTRKILRTTDGSAWSSVLTSSVLPQSAALQGAPLFGYDGTTLAGLFWSGSLNSSFTLTLAVSTDEGATWTVAYSPEGPWASGTNAPTFLSQTLAVMGNRMLAVYNLNSSGLYANLMDLRKAVFAA